MWQASNQKTRSTGSSGKSGSGRSRRPIHIRRVTVEIKLKDGLLSEPGRKGTMQARLLLNDLNPRGVELFCSAKMADGQEVAIVIAEPSIIYLRGKIRWTQEHDMNSHVISDTPFPYRVGIQFTFENAAEEAAVKKYCDDLAQSLLPAAA